MHEFLLVLYYFFLSCLVILLFFCIGIYLYDASQYKSALRRNFPLLGRFRYLFEHWGKFLRAYFFAFDREEMPFNRADRSWVYRAAKNKSNQLSFGSSKRVDQPGNFIFVSSAFPILKNERTPLKPITIGENCKYPYQNSRFFHISGMSYGALSSSAITALSEGAKSAGIWLNTGEGGLSDFHLSSGCDLVFQIGTAKFGVRDEMENLDEKCVQKIAKIPNVKMFELKLSQGAKPGKGGILPATKVTESIAQARGIPVGVASKSPNRHRDISNCKDLLDLINKIRNLSDKPVGFKTVVSSYIWLDELFTLIVRQGLETAPDFITIDSCDGGTGSAPMSLLDNMGLPIQETLIKVLNLLKKYGLRERIKVIASGKLIHPSSVAWALAVGADFVVSARGFMFSLGCIQALKCNKNTCPTGITTHDKKLQKALDPKIKSVRVANYVYNMHKDIEMIANSCGARNARQLNRSHLRIIFPPHPSVQIESLYDE